MKIADRVAYINHDVDDAVRAGILREEDIPEEITCAIGSGYGNRIDTIVKNIVENSMERAT